MDSNIWGTVCNYDRPALHIERKPLLVSCLELFHVKVLRDVSNDNVIKV
jgi:hypothetical protein